MPSPSRWRAPVRLLPFQYLLVIPILLAVATIITLFVNSDVNLALLWSQCHSHARIPFVSRLPGLGTPLCYLVSFFQEALDSQRSAAVMAVVLAFVGGLLTVNTVEAARLCNAANVLIAYPTGSWLVFNLIGGAVVWELVLIPAFLYRTKRIIAQIEADQDDPDDEVASEDKDRRVPDTEVVAIPLSIAIGYYLPSILMLVFRTPAFVGVWLFFPIYVSILRYLIRTLITLPNRVESSKIHFESDWRCIVSIYAIPIIGSLLAQINIVYNMTQPDDRVELVRSVMSFIDINVEFVAWTVLYWVLVEVGWQVPLAMFCTSTIVGPGAGTCLGWVYRERFLNFAQYSGDEDEDEQTDEETPLLQ